MTKYIRVNGMLYVRTDSEEISWKTEAKKAYKILLDIWLNDGSTKKDLRDLDTSPEKLREKFGVYISDLLESEADIVDWEAAYEDLRKEED